MKKRSKRRLSYQDDHLRRGEYSQKTTGYLPNARTLCGKYKASPGDFIVWQYPLKDGSLSEPHFGRMLAMVDAPRESEEIPAVKNNLAVLELEMTMSCCWVRWISPEWVREVRAEVSKSLMAWFFGIGNEDPVATGDLKTILQLAHRGSLSGNYVDKIEYCPECKGLLNLPMGRGPTCTSEPGECPRAAREHEAWDRELAEWREAREEERRSRVSGRG